MAGFQEPTDRSPFPLLPGWSGGGTEAIGGGGQARIWYGPDNVRIIYELHNRNVQLQRRTGTHYEHVKTVKAANSSDKAQQKAAEQLIEDVTEISFERIDDDYGEFGGLGL